MDVKKWAVLGAAGLLLVSYNAAQPDLVNLRNNNVDYGGIKNKREGYGPSLVWLDRLALASQDKDSNRVKLDFSVLSSLMVAGLASGFKSQVANLMWMKSDEYWHQGLFTRQVPLMEAVVTLDPQFIEAWSTAGWRWAYNIYADIPANPDNKAKGEKTIRAKQEDAIATGLDYLGRGSNLNPDKYRLWFEHGWTRAEKAGLYDDETLKLYATARTKSDARIIEIAGPGGKMVKQEGLDLMGRTMAHMLERMPNFERALDLYANDLMGASRADRANLDAVGRAWSRYGEAYLIILDAYNKSDAVDKAKIKKLVPEIDEIIAGHATRVRIAGQKGKDQPVGAYVSISARYMPAHEMMKRGDYEGAITKQIGVMNADPKYHLQGLPVLAKVMEIRGDSPAAIAAELKTLRQKEKDSSQDLGLHFLARLYEMAAQKSQKSGDSQAFDRLNQEAYRTWYRSRARDQLDYYALRQTRIYEDKYGFTEPKDITKAIKESRKGGTPDAAPKSPNGFGIIGRQQ